jgi:D-glycero-alpha-D-manno-heptose-7-phosphate kinase
MSEISAASAPLRLSLAGGGTDLPEHYQRWGCHLITLTLDHRVHVEITRSDSGRIEVLTPEGEWEASSTDDLDLIEVARALDEFGIASGVRITIRNAVPSGSGLGGSGAMLVALVGALSASHGRSLDPDDAAAIAYNIERNRAARPVGHQDHVAAAHGGLVRLTIEPGGRPQVTRDEQLYARAASMLDHELLMFQTPLRRSSASVLTQQTSRIESGAAEMGMAALSSLVGAFETALRTGSVRDLGHLLDQHWQAKRAATPATSTPQIDEWYEQAREAGALGGKLVGAGGGGCLLLAVLDTERQRVESRLRQSGVVRLPVQATPHGLIIHRRPPVAIRSLSGAPEEWRHHK